MKFSKFADIFETRSCISQLMHDLTDATQPEQTRHMLGGRSPSHIPQVQQLFRNSMQKLLIGPEEVIQRITHINAVVSLSPGGMGTAIAMDLVQTGQILSMSETLIQPFYREKMEFAVSMARKYFTGLNAAVHTPEGAFFL
jgi:alanine-alpha-ketoisovalerate/valine-pyruvate aminotransferase